MNRRDRGALPPLGRVSPKTQFARLAAGGNRIRTAGTPEDAGLVADLYAQRVETDPGKLRVPRFRRDRHVDTRSPRAGSAAQPIARRVHPPARLPNPLRAYGASGRRWQGDWVPSVAALGIHYRSSSQRRRRPRHARLRATSGIGLTIAYATLNDFRVS